MDNKIEITAVRSEPYWVDDQGSRKVAVVVDTAERAEVVLVMAEPVGVELARLFIRAKPFPKAGRDE